MTLLFTFVNDSKNSKVNKMIYFLHKKTFSRSFFKWKGLEGNGAMTITKMTLSVTTLKQNVYKNMTISITLLSLMTLEVNRTACI